MAVGKVGRVEGEKDGKLVGTEDGMIVLYSGTPNWKYKPDELTPILRTVTTNTNRLL